MVVEVTISVTMHTNEISTSVILGPSVRVATAEEEAARKLLWPYNYSEDSALLPSSTQESPLIVT